jgi:hypothetical protein
MVFRRCDGKLFICRILFNPEMGRKVKTPPAAQAAGDV